MNFQPTQSPMPVSSIPPRPSTPRIMKLIPFLLALLLVAISGYLYLENMNLKNQLGISPKPLFPKSCEYNGVTYQPGEGFPSTDGCNSCSCSENGEVACTLMACEVNQGELRAYEYQSENQVFNISNNSNGFQTQFSDTEELVATDCDAIHGYPLVVYSKTNPRIGDGPCGVEGPTGIRKSKFEKSSVNGLTCSAFGQSSVENYAFSETTDMKGSYQITTCRNDLTGPEMGERGPRPTVILATYITTDVSPWIYNVSLTDKNLTSTYDQILSTFEFTN